MRDDVIGAEEADRIVAAFCIPEFVGHEEDNGAQECLSYLLSSETVAEWHGIRTGPGDEPGDPGVHGEAGCQGSARLPARIGPVGVYRTGT